MLIDADLLTTEMIKIPGGIPRFNEDMAFCVVRCRDCIHRQGDENPMCMLHTEPYANARGYKGEAVCVEMNGFCSYGERRKSNENHT
jgi:hypothetical protein